jgi:hypothetical protein
MVLGIMQGNLSLKSSLIVRAENTLEKDQSHPYGRSWVVIHIHICKGIAGWNHPPKDQKIKQFQHYVLELHPMHTYVKRIPDSRDSTDGVPIPLHFHIL